MSAATEILLHLRSAAANARIAVEIESKAEKEYEEKMKSAGASVFAAFVAAINDAPEFKGRKIDEAAVRRLYTSTKPRPWWDKWLSQVRVAGAPATREWASRTIQWHLDPEGAKARRHKHNALRAVNHARLKEKLPTRGRRHPQAEAAADIAKMNAAVAASQERLPAERAFDAPEDGPVELSDLLAQLSRMSSAVRHVEPANRATVLAILTTTVREIERYAR